MMLRKSCLGTLRRIETRLTEDLERGRSHQPDLDEVEVASALAHPASLAAWLSHGDLSCWLVEDISECRLVTLFTDAC